MIFQTHHFSLPRLCSSVFFIALIVDPSVARAVKPSVFKLDPATQEILGNYCTDCHEDGTTKGDVRLDNLESLPLEARLTLLNRMQEQIVTAEMPPKKKDQPTDEERSLLVEWIGKDLRVHNASKLEEKLRKPEYGNVVDHGKLFSGKYKDLPAFSPDRRWLISEFIFDAKINQLLEYKGGRILDKQRVQMLGENSRQFIIHTNITNPYLLPNRSGVRYYDTETLNGGHLLTMLSNAREYSGFVFQKVRQQPQYLPSLSKIMAAEWTQEKILASRERYLKDQIEPLLSELFKEKHDSMKPVFVAPKSLDPVPDDGKPNKHYLFDMNGFNAEEKDVIWRPIHKHITAGVNGEALVQKCVQDWFYLGLDERAIEIRITFMRRFMEQLSNVMPKSFPAPIKPPAEPEMAIIHAALLEHRKAGDTYLAVIAKCMDEWTEGFKQERINAGGISDEATGNLVDETFAKIFERAPTEQEKAKYVALTKSYYADLSSEKAISKMIESLLLRTEFVYRQEFGEGDADEHGRSMLSPRNASYALSYALTDSSPDKQLAEAAATGKLNTREDYRREVERMLKIRDTYYVVDPAVEPRADSFTNLPIRKLRFFREFFGYPAMLGIFKDNKRFGGDSIQAAPYLLSETDKLVERILAEDQNVFEQLLTTEEFYVFHSGDNAVMRTGSENVGKIYEYFKDKDWKNFDVAEFKKHVPFLKEAIMRGMSGPGLDNEQSLKQMLPGFKNIMTSYMMRMDKGQTAAVPFPAFSSHDATETVTRTGKAMWGVEVAKHFNIDLTNWSYPIEQPAKMPYRKGILTHPAWLMAFAKNTESDPIHRGKWVLEKLLAGTVPDVPITVDAKIPEDHTKTLRNRLDKATTEQYCWRCHERMNPLGTPFEMYDDFGRFRTEERLEHPDNLIKTMPSKGSIQDDLRDIYKTLPIDSSGNLAGTGDPALDGDVKDAIDLATRLGKSARVRQSIIRHAFRYFMGRNEFLSDSKTLMDAEEAYLKSGGSFDAVIVSLLTSDSFIYRKPSTN